MATIKRLEGMPAPRFGKHCYFSEGAVIVGDVEMGDDCTVWFNAVVRGDVHFVKIGNRTNIQDNSCIHTLNEKAACILGDDVTIGHSVTLHGCEVKDGALIGMGATVLDHAVVGKGAIVAAGALVLSNTQIGDGELWGGVPAKFIKKVDPEQAQALNKTYAAHYIEYSDWFRKADADPKNTQVVTTSEEYNPSKSPRGETCDYSLPLGGVGEGSKLDKYMRKKKFFTLMLCLMAGWAMQSCINCKYQKSYNLSWTNPLPVKFGDPFLLHASDGRYYMYGTSMEDGFEAYVSDSLGSWESCGRVYQGGQADQWNVNCFWAPEVYERDGKYYMFFSANYKENPTNEGENFKIGVAVSDSPAGPFKDLYDRPIFNPDYPIIDANVYFDDETGKCYLYYSRCCYKHSVESEIADKLKAEGVYDNIEESWVYGVEMKPDFSGVIGEPKLLLCPPKKLNDAQAEWESRSAMHKEVNRRWTEGSYIFREGDTYYIMYSANHFGGKYYAVGYATSKNPLGPFKKADNNPVLQEDGEVLGTGHCMVITLPNDKRYCVYHGRMADNPEERVVLISPLEIDKEGKLTVIQGIKDFHESMKCGLFYEIKTGILIDDDKDSDEEEKIEDEEEEEEIEEDFEIEDEE